MSDKLVSCCKLLLQMRVVANEAILLCFIMFYNLPVLCNTVTSVSHRCYSYYRMIRGAQPRSDDPLMLIHTSCGRDLQVSKFVSLRYINP